MPLVEEPLERPQHRPARLAAPEVHFAFRAEGDDGGDGVRVLEGYDRVIPPIDHSYDRVGGAEIDAKPHAGSVPIDPGTPYAIPHANGVWQGVSPDQLKRAGWCRASRTGERYAARGISRQPSSDRCGVSPCTSTIRNPRSRSRSAQAAKAALDAPLTRWNIDSPANSPPNAMPYSPPASVLPCHASTLCAQPRRCSSEYVERMSGVIQVPSPGRLPQARMTSSNASSKETRKPAFSARRTVRGHGSIAWSGKIARGSGEAQGTRPCRTGQGKMPALYASSTNAGERARLTATTSSPCRGSGKRTPTGGGSIGGYGGTAALPFNAPR